jgi:DNA-directed RNA polymerase specialized sigma24 family protein
VSARFARLMARLDTDGEPAGAVYERLHRRLVQYFRIHAPAAAEALADESLDRLAQRLDDGVAVEHVAGYLLGIARLVRLEFLKREQRAARADARWRAVAAPDGPGAEDERSLAALERCMQGLDPAARTLLLEYYADGDGSARIERRHALAARASLTANALRNRALRLRTALERCVRAALGTERDE